MAGGNLRALRALWRREILKRKQARIFRWRAAGVAGAAQIWQKSEEIQMDYAYNITKNKKRPPERARR